MRGIAGLPANALGRPPVSTPEPRRGRNANGSKSRPGSGSGMIMGTMTGPIGTSFHVEIDPDGEVELLRGDRHRRASSSLCASRQPGPSMAAILASTAPADPAPARASRSIARPA